MTRWIGSTRTAGARVWTASIVAMVLLVGSVCGGGPVGTARAQAEAGGEQGVEEDDYYAMHRVSLPEDVHLEVGGMALLPDDRLAVATRRGEIWTFADPLGEEPDVRRFARGLHEPLGLLFEREGRRTALVTAQRGELTRIVDRSGDGVGDRYETVARWPLSGNYHEYSYGPVRAPDGGYWVSFNLAHNFEGDPFFGEMASFAPWRGWIVRVTPEGELHPVAAGARSPAGLGLSVEGDLFFAENQGGWVGSGRITHVEEGDFFGHPAGLLSSNRPGSPLDLGPHDVPDSGRPLVEVAREIPALKPPAVWFPQGIMGISTSDILADTVGGRFGPFGGDLFVGDQGHSRIMRVDLERVDGIYQGTVFPFRDGFESGVLRLAWGRDGELFVGMTDRGWQATGGAPYGLQALTWTGEVPFEMAAIRARPDGFEIRFTRPVAPELAADTSRYAVAGFTYRYDHDYGSPVIDRAVCPIRSVQVGPDGRTVRLRLDGLREGYVHEVQLDGLTARDGTPLLHEVGYYTLNRIPGN